ncbi:hypothetical protein PUV47_15970, partial [Pseudovibrio exalbescens]|uniref:hypothetical protein n=1 Tax=Pseudovibrio exalbescens TaxID=197461 RepID=UPI0023650D06
QKRAKWKRKSTRKTTKSITKIPLFIKGMAQAPWVALMAMRFEIGFCGHLARRQFPTGNHCKKIDFLAAGPIRDKICESVCISLIGFTARVDLDVNWIT